MHRLSKKISWFYCEQSANADCRLTLGHISKNTQGPQLFLGLPFKGFKEKFVY